MSSKLNAFDNLNFEALTSNKPEYKQIDWMSIQSDSKFNIRDYEKYTEDPELHDLAYSILKFGLRQPIILYRDKNQKNRYKIWHGQRRFSAIKLVHENEELNYSVNNENYKISREDKSNFLKVPCIILPEPEDNSQRILKQIAENEHRKDVDNLEICKQYHELLKSNSSWNQEILAEKIGKSKQMVSDICGLVRINSKIQKLLSEIQLYGYTIKAIEEKNLVIKDYDNVAKKIGIKTLRSIASSKDQNTTFWEFFGNKCSKVDAGFLNYEKEKEVEKELTYLDSFNKLNTEYIKMAKKIDLLPADKQAKLKDKKVDLAKNIIKQLIKDNNIQINDLK